MLQETFAGFQVRQRALPPLHQARRGVYSCVQAAAADRVEGRCDILDSAKNGDGVLVLCHLITNAHRISQKNRE